MIHFTGTLPADARIVEETLEEFSGWQAWRLRRAHYGVNPLIVAFKSAGTCYSYKKDDAEIVLMRAIELLKDPSIRFNLFTKNCEGFVFHCMTGRGWQSTQASSIPLPGDLLRIDRFLVKAKYWWGITCLVYQSHQFTFVFEIFFAPKIQDLQSGVHSRRVGLDRLHLRFRRGSN